MKKVISFSLKSVFLTFAVLTVGGCASSGGSTSSGGSFFEIKSLHKCSKCGKEAVMLNSILKEQNCPVEGKHHWQYIL